MSIADELEKLEELRRQRVISNEEFDIAKKKVLSDDYEVDKPRPQNQSDGLGGFGSLNLVTGKQDRVGSVDVDRFGTPDEVGDALDEMAERELEAEQHWGMSGAHDRDRSQRHDRDILGEIASLDRQWDLERDNYRVTGKHGHQYTPTKGGSVFTGVVAVVFGGFWLVMATSITSGMRGVGAVFPLFGVLFICAGIGLSIWSYSKAEKYERAQQRYRQRRRELENQRR